MALGTIASKTYGTALEERNLVLEPGVAYQRLTSLPDNWTKVRIALVLSFTNLTEFNGTPVAENPNGNSSRCFTPWVGMSNGRGLPGGDGVKFVGFTGIDEYPCSITNTQSGWGLRTGIASGGVFKGATVIANGYSINREPDRTDPSHANFYTPSASTSFAFAWMLELETNGGSLNKSHCTIGNVSDPATSVNRAISSAKISEYSRSGGWWNSSSTFCGCKHLFIRFPFLNNRLRLHALKVMQLA